MTDHTEVFSEPHAVIRQSMSDAEKAVVDQQPVLLLGPHDDALTSDPNVDWIRVRNPQG